MKKIIIYLYLLGAFVIPSYAQKNILFFISQENTYYSEYIVMKEALEDLGYTIDVRSATTSPATCYMIPSNTTIDATANTLVGSSYATFQSQYLNMFGSSWNSGVNAIPANIPTQGSILDISNMNGYYALVIAGGTGILDYRYDGSYTAQGSVNVNTVQQVAEKLNSLSIDALSKGKPLLAQCHGASLPIYWRVPGTIGSGVETLGISILKNQYATGYPEPQTSTTLANFGVNYHPESKVVIATPNENLNTAGKGNYKIITSRDWYPQTVAYTARTLANMLETYPSVAQRTAVKNILIIHGGTLNSSNCSPANRTNDIPCNYGNGSNLPADYSTLNTLLSSSTTDGYNFTVTDLNITAPILPYDGGSQSSILTYFNNYDVIIFFKHWSTGITNNLQNALKAYVEDGGGLIAIHHGLYNDIDGTLSKNILTNDLFQIESSMSGWSANLTNHSMFATNYGHFISNYNINYQDATPKPTGWTGTPILSGSNYSDSYYSAFNIYDELYNNMSFINTPIFGRSVNEITPLFSHSITPASIYHTAGFTKLYNGNSDSKIGRLVFFQPGERTENLTVSHPYGQVIRNAVFWASIDEIEYEQESITSLLISKKQNDLNIYPNPARDMVYISSANQILKVDITDSHGKIIPATVARGNNFLQIIFEEESSTILFIQVQTNQGQHIYKLIRQ